MPEHFSLLARAWIPVALADGRRVFVRPCEISEPYEGKPILRIATGRPDCDIALTEFLIGLLAVTMDGLDRRSWPKRFRDPPSSEELEVTFAPLEPAMILDGDGPRFFQDREALEGKPTPIVALQMDAAGSSTHFVKEGRTEKLSRIGAAITLLTLQTQAPSGGAGHRTSLRGGGPLTTLVLPGLPDKAVPTLWQRLWANTPEDFHAEPDEYNRVFPWLTPTRVSDKTGVETTPDHVHPAQAFFGMPRRIRLLFEEARDGDTCDLTGERDDVMVSGYVTKPWGTNYTAWSKGHPLSPYYTQKAKAVEFLPLHTKSSRIGYRQYLGLAFESEDGLRLPAKCVSEFRKTRANEFSGDAKQAMHDCQILVAGYAMDNMKPLDFAETLVPLVITGNPTSDKHVHDTARRFVNGSDETARLLISSVKRALYGERGDAARDSTVLEPVANRFWSDTERDFYDALRDAADRLISPDGVPVTRPGDTKRDLAGSWLAILKRHAFAIFDEVVPIDSAEADRIADVIAGRKSLGLALAGHGAVGKKLYTALGVALPSRKTGKDKP
ncbi:MAG TPA: type I-E CRISPR-associated protein Cse1/CasA [Hyphomicrobiaceae bacterium]|nr:type I-E CRISPR-associated protein Cse1/CasA [Hyphomicrobiaceae bacterium]MCC0011108.1 type I-E CRISPR-associated protein Cse1/CasA [Hyphomicrobiaceae bacterium]HRY07686.1 type I-E CRISPR-associated protein Cse1/CasA [Hyphomicrobiaceae bacterium]